jgi:glycosyltransferase involved in cell wall biosynthesis
MLLSIVIPVYNEAGNLQLTLQALQSELCKVGCDTEIVFVNDGSTDESQGNSVRSCRLPIQRSRS